MTNPKEKRETLEGRVDAMFPGLKHFSIKIKEDFIGLIKGEIKQAFEETRGELKACTGGLYDETCRACKNLEHNKFIQETIKRQEEYINNL